MPVGPGEASRQQRAPTQQKVAADKEQLWRQFVSVVGREKKFLALDLDNAKMLELVPGRLSIGVGERHRLSSLQDPENLASLKSIAKGFFSEDVAIEVKLIAEGTAEQGRDNVTVSSAAAKFSDMANETLRVFPGSSVRSVRRDAGEG